MFSQRIERCATKLNKPLKHVALHPTHHVRKLGRQYKRSRFTLEAGKLHNVPKEVPKVNVCEACKNLTGRAPQPRSCPRPNTTRLPHSRLFLLCYPLIIVIIIDVRNRWPDFVTMMLSLCRSPRPSTNDATEYPAHECTKLCTAR